MISKKIGFYLLLFVSMMIINFWLPRLMPGGPIAYLEGGGSDSVPMVMTQEQKERLNAYYHLDDPLHEQFIQFMNGLLHGDLGVSIHYKTSVLELILNHGKWTLFLVGISMLLTVGIGGVLGLRSAWSYSRKKDVALYGALLTIGAVPEFVIAIILLLFLSIQLQWFPLGGSLTPFFEYGQGLLGKLRYLGDLLRHGALPILTLTLGNVAGIYLLMRSSALSVRLEPYVLAAEAKGLPLKRILYRHALKNALLPIMTMISLRLAFLFTGAILVETVFSYPGMGKLLYTAILSRDYPLMHGLFLIFTAGVLIMNLVADLLYPVLDPRIRRKGRGDDA